MAKSRKDDEQPKSSKGRRQDRRQQRREKRREAEQVKRRGPSGQEEVFTEHYHKNQEQFDAGATGGGKQQRPVENPYAGAEEGGSQKIPRGAPSKKSTTKASASLSGGLRPPGGSEQYLRDNPRNPQHQLEAISIIAGQLDRQLRKAVPDSDERHQLAAEMAIDKYRADNKNIQLQKVNKGTVAAMIDDPKISKLSKGETTAYTKRKSKLQESLEERSKKIQDEYRTKRPPRSIQKQGGGEYATRGGVGKPIHHDTEQRVQEAQAKMKQLKPGDSVKKGKLSNQQFLLTLSPEEEAWVNQQRNQPGGLFYGAKGNKVPGAYRRWQRYSNARQAGAAAPINEHGQTDSSHSTYDWLTTDLRGRSSVTNPNRRNKKATDEGVQERFTGGVTRKSGTKQRDRYKSMAPSHEEFGVGIRVPGIPTTSNLKEENPDLSDREIFELRESYKQSVEDMLQNQRMAHENRQATLLGRDKSETGAGSEDRVVFFTTSTGYPAISVGANSLLGQYIVKKRKKMVYDQRMASRAELKGEFPYAVRDQHVVEVATGLSLGAQGRYGAFRHMGWRAGSKKSKGYGKMLPVGSQILRDSSGQPLYDRNGNLRYTEGFTRPFDLRPSNEVGMRIYLG